MIKILNFNIFFVLKNFILKSTIAKMEKNIHNEIFLGFTEKPAKGDFDYENFPSKIGGKPVWLYPPTDLDLNFFKCTTCNRDLFFLLQIYCPLEEFAKSFHRVIYVFFCHMCWKKTNGIKVLRMQLPENSEYYKGSSLTSKDFFNQDIKGKLDKNLRYLEDEFVIITDKECNQASNIYYHFYDLIDEKSKKSRTNSISGHHDDEDFDELVPDMDNEKVNSMVKNYLKEEGITEDQVIKLITENLIII